MNAAKNGIVAEFVTGYLQREIRIEARVVGGTDTGLRDATKVGYAPGRLVRLSTAQVDGVQVPAFVAPVGVTATSIGNATHIIAQSDDTIRDLPEDYNYTERYSTLPNGICKNSGVSADAPGEEKTIAVYSIVNTDDIKIINLT